MIKVKHLNKAFGSIPVLRDLNLTVNGPLVLMGPSGCGKTTLLRILMGLETPDSGTVQGVGNIGAVFQESRLCPQLTAVGNICLVGGVNPAQAQAELQTLGFTQAELALPVARLSGGQKRRVAIAGVLAMDPKVLILDEPTAGLDPRGRDTILGEIREYHEERKNTVLLVSHSMEDIAQYAKKVLVIAEGKPAMYDTVENIFSRVEELTAMGLAVPQISRVFAGLRAAGYQVPGNIYTVEGAAAAILNAVKGGAAR